MKPRRRALAVVAVLLCAPLAAGCSPGGDDRHTVTAEQAAPRIETLLSGTVSAVKPPMQYLDGLYDIREHTDWKHDSDGKSLVRKQRYLMPMISSGKRAVLFQQVKDYWKAQGCTIEEDSDGSGRKAVSATAPDGTRVGVSILGGGDATITAGIDPVVTPPLDHPLRNTSVSPRPPGTPEPGSGGATVFNPLPATGFGPIRPGVWTRGHPRVRHRGNVKRVTARGPAGGAPFES